MKSFMLVKIYQLSRAYHGQLQAFQDFWGKFCCILLNTWAHHIVSLCEGFGIRGGAPSFSLINSSSSESSLPSTSPFSFASPLWCAASVASWASPTLDFQKQCLSVLQTYQQRSKTPYSRAPSNFSAHKKLRTKFWLSGNINWGSIINQNWRTCNLRFPMRRTMSKMWTKLSIFAIAKDSQSNIADGLIVLWETLLSTCLWCSCFEKDSMQLSSGMMWSVVCIRLRQIMAKEGNRVQSWGPLWFFHQIACR